VAASVAAPVVLVGGGLATLSLSDETDFDAWEAAGVTMLATGVLVGPSAGHAYTGHWGKAAAFSLGRAVCVGVFTVGATGLTETALLAGLGEEGETESDPFDVVLTLGGLAGWVGLSAWEAVETWDSAQEAGRRSERPSVQVSARVFRSPPVPEAGGHGWGLAVSGSY